MSSSSSSSNSSGSSNNSCCNGQLMKETEGLLMAAQEQAIRTRKISHAIDKADISPK